MIKKVKLGLNIKFILVTCSIILFTSILLSYFFIDKQYRLLKDFTESRVLALAESITKSSEYAIASSEPNIEFLHHLTKDSLKNEDILYSTIYNKNGICLVSQTRGNENIKKYVSSTPIESSLIKSLEKNRIQKDIISISKVGKVMDIMLPVVSVDFDTEIKTKKEDREIILGSVRIGVSLNEINAQKNSMIRSAILLTLFILFIGAIFSFFFVKIITKEYSSLGTNK